MKEPSPDRTFLLVPAGIPISIEPGPMRLGPWKFNEDKQEWTCDVARDVKIQTHHTKRT